MAESNSEENRLSPADSAAHHIITAAPQRLRKPEIALVCGSGLSDLDALVDPLDRFEISYEQIPYMHATSGEDFCQDYLSYTN